MMENIRKYGVLIDFASHFRDTSPEEWPSVLTVLAFGVPIVIALVLERMALDELHTTLRQQSGSAAASPATAAAAAPFTPVPRASALQVANVAGVILGPVLSIRIFHPSPVASLVVMMLAIVLAAVRDQCPPVAHGQGHPSPMARATRRPRRG